MEARAFYSQIFNHRFPFTDFQSQLSIHRFPITDKAERVSSLGLICWISWKMLLLTKTALNSSWGQRKMGKELGRGALEFTLFRFLSLNDLPFKCSLFKCSFKCLKRMQLFIWNGLGKLLIEEKWLKRNVWCRSIYLFYSRRKIIWMPSPLQSVNFRSETGEKVNNSLNGKIFTN